MIEILYVSEKLLAIEESLKINQVSHWSLLQSFSEFFGIATIGTKIQKMKIIHR